MLDPEVVFRHDRTAVPLGASREVSGALAVAKQFAGRAQAARPVLVNGAVGVVVAPRGRLLLVLDLTIRHGQIAAINVIAEPARLQKLDLAVLGPCGRHYTQLEPIVAHHRGRLKRFPARFWRYYRALLRATWCAISRPC